MRTRSGLTLAVFIVCALAVVECLAWVTYLALRGERREAIAHAEAVHQDGVLRALWRMDSELAPLIAAEAARPYFQYRSFYPAERAYTRMWQEVSAGEVLVPSPILQSPDPLILLHFERTADGRIASPQAPTGNMLDLAESFYVPSARVVEAEGLLGELRTLLDANAGQLGFVADASVPRPASATPTPPVQNKDLLGKSSKEYDARRKVVENAQAIEPQVARGIEPQQASESPQGETRLRVEAVREESAYKAVAPSLGVNLNLENRAPATGVVVGAMSPAWRTNPLTGDPELLFTRQVTLSGEPTTQGFWLDWPAVRDRLLARAKDLLPSASLVPVLDAGASAEAELGRMLAAVPARLDVPLPSIPRLPLLTPTRIGLGVSWAAVLVAIAAFGVVLRTWIRLSERRGRFVSAVTHELRTPLTTFCLYTQMLDDGMVKRAEDQARYLSTLRQESSRLARIVENVLDFARLGRARPGNGAGSCEARELIASVVPILERRASLDDMAIEVQDDGRSARVVVESQSFERILTNLVDNACKYAKGSADRRIVLGFRVTGRWFEARVRDFGGGVRRSNAKQIFLPFQRVEHEGDSISGLGLGLALARGIAREFGGDLVLNSRVKTGAEFVITLVTSGI